MEIVSNQVMNAMADTQTPQGILCLIRCFHYRMEDLAGQAVSGGWSDGKRKSHDQAPLYMVLENLQDPGNLGTIVRTAEGAGVTGILLSGDCVDIYNPKVIRSTMGSIYRMPFFYTDQLENCLKQFKQDGIRLFAAHLKGKLAYYDESYLKPTAFLIGNEGNGLTEAVSSLADHRIRIPMAGKVESLNAAVSASILMYEAARQRNCTG